ncbi:MAG: TonB family protein [Bacteroidetes bacterium]|nr:TonB family protein [Bacteroidota bacterium]MBU1718649.1 TonB family protein [Bacteroidota bacterium]
MKATHEYLADEGVLMRGFDKREYQKTLLEQQLGVQVNDLTNNFNHSLLKRRILVMARRPAAKVSLLKLLVLLPVLSVLVVAISCTDESDNDLSSQSKIAGASGNDSNYSLLVGSDIEKVYNEVETMPEFKGGQPALTKMIVENITYPDDAKRNGISGKVVVEFVIEKDGKVTNIKLKEGIGYGCDEEAIRVISQSPPWNPGAVNGNPVRTRVMLPFKFNLS